MGVYVSALVVSAAIARDVVVIVVSRGYLVRTVLLFVVGMFVVATSVAGAADAVLADVAAAATLVVAASEQAN